MLEQYAVVQLFQDVARRDCGGKEGTVSTEQHNGGHEHRKRG